MTLIKCPIANRGYYAQAIVPTCADHNRAGANAHRLHIDPDAGVELPADVGEYLLG